MMDVKSGSCMWLVSSFGIVSLLQIFMEGVTCSVGGIEPEVDQIGAKTTIFFHNPLHVWLAGFILAETTIL